MPNLGLIVTAVDVWIGWLGSTTILNLRAIVASSSVDSIIANDAPMHNLGPPPKGK